MIKDYVKHAAVWDWDGYDNTPEYEYWCGYAARFGKKVLIPMCALGQAGAYMARKGFRVTAFDITKEMITEGIKRFGTVQGLSLVVADICNFQFDEKGFDFSFLASQDLHLLSDIETVAQAFASIAAHLRKGACLSLELILPPEQSYEYPKQTYYPRVRNYADKKVWKEGKGRYDAVTRKHFIDQVVYIQEDKEITSFNHSIILQYYQREEIIGALSGAGFAVVGEYGNRDKEPWNPQSLEWIVEAIKQ
jgi:hypothetical protein